MVEVLAKCVFASNSGLPEDDVVTDWSFQAADLTSATLDGIAASIISFWDTANTTRRIDEYVGDQVSRASNAAAINFYDVSGALDGGPTGSPVHVVPWTVGAGAGAADYPSEVAMRVSLLADGWPDVPETAVNPTPPPAFIRPRARYRGGFYIGPLSTVAASQASGTSEPRPSAAFQADLSVAAIRFMDERGGDFCVWSRADEVFRLIAPDGSWLIDDAFDTIRKRGQRHTVRYDIWP